MVSARPPPNPAKGRVAYPAASTYTPGDAETSPTYLGSSEPVQASLSRSPDKEEKGFMGWWRSFDQQQFQLQERAQQDKTEPPSRSGQGQQGQGQQGQGQHGVFGVPLQESVEYASVQISTAGADGSLYVWGVIPVVVAKCGLYLKENGTEVEGTFRISGSAKRMRDLQAIFDGGPKYGKNIDWSALSYTTHDVATIFRRFLTQMPEPIIPFDFYNEFRDILSQEESTEETIEHYKSLIRALPPVNQYLLLYVLDLLSVFAKKSDVNLMTTPNLALIFQPGVLSHPVHSMRPREHVLSQQVLEFLIEQQDHFLMSMQLQPKKKRKNEKAKSPSPLPSLAPLTPEPQPVRTKAEPDFMLPSDSDDEAPEEGYYVIENDESKLPASQPSAPISVISPAQLFPPPPTARLVLRQVSKVNGYQTTVNPTRPSPQPIIEMMEPSDSDDDAPPGGYEVFTGDLASGQKALFARASNKQKSSSRPFSAPRPDTASSIRRRRTMPSRPAVSGYPAQGLGDVKEAP